MTNVFVAIYEHRHGTDVNVFATEAGAQAWKDELARDYWSSYCEGEPPSEGAGDAYFEAAGEYGDGEFFSLEEHPIKEELPPHLKLAHALAADDVEALVDRGDFQRIADYASKHLEGQYAHLPPDELRAVVEERAPYLMEPLS